MENVFEELLAESTADNSSINTPAETNSASDGGDNDFDHTYDLDLDSLTSDDEQETQPEEVGEESDETGGIQSVGVEDINPTNAAFAQMRTQNKEFQNKLGELNELAQSLGLKDYDELIARGKEAQIRKEAETKGLPIEVAQELAEFREFRDSIIAEKEEAAIKQQQDRFVSDVREFISENKLADAQVDKLSKDLEKDGLSVDMLMAMPKTALNRVLKTYIGADYQKNLERKENIKRELPISQSSKIDTQVLNKEIDTLAKQLAGKI